MQCRKCKKDCLEEELTNGFCSECFEKNNGDYTKLHNVKNPVAMYFNVWAISVACIGIILSIIFGINTENIASSIIYIACSLLSASFLKALSEIIQLLEDIKNK